MTGAGQAARTSELRRWKGPGHHIDRTKRPGIASAVHSRATLRDAQALGNRKMDYPPCRWDIPRQRMKLFHVSDQPGIHVFMPRPSTATPGLGPVVWAVDGSHLPNYLLPRDCPRVTFAAAAGTSPEDRQRFGIQDHTRVVVVERSWLNRIERGTIFRYQLPSEPFRLFDGPAGYWVSLQPVTPLDVVTVHDIPGSLAGLGAELRAVSNLWSLHQAVAQSTLEFSMIRMRNAGPPPRRV